MTRGTLESLRSFLLLCASVLVAAVAGAEDLPTPSALDACLEARSLPRIARVVDPDGQVVYARVLRQVDGLPTIVVTVAEATTPLAETFDRVPKIDPKTYAVPAFAIEADERSERVCAPVGVSQAELDAHERVIVAAGLNYAAHAEESGGGDVFLFPKPSAPTGPYAQVHPPAGVVLLDYEVELGVVLLRDIDLRNPPTGDALLASTAFFVGNDLSDRAPIVLNKDYDGPGTGFVDGKGQPGFLPAGPWVVRGSELFAALEACGADGFGIELSVDEGEGAQPRQSATTAEMILDLPALLAGIAAEIGSNGRFSEMPLHRDGKALHYPFAVDDAAPRLPAGSIVLTGTPEGVAIGQVEPNALSLIGRGLLSLQGPFAQFVDDETERAAEGGSYLKLGDRVHARIDGLGAQDFTIGPADGSPAADPCRR